MKKYFVIINNKIKGPYTNEELAKNKIKRIAFEYNEERKDLTNQEINIPVPIEKSKKAIIIIIILFVMLVGFSILYFMLMQT